MNRIHVHPDVAEALTHMQPVVALESAVLTTGLPREPLHAPPAFDAPQWNDSQPVNLEIVRLMQRSVREAGAVPAVVAVMDGSLHIGLDDDAIEQLARDETAGKASTTNLAAAINSKQSAGTTVSATLHACAIAGMHSPDGNPIRVFATGGIGGVHRNWTRSPDVSADLLQIAATPTCVVCAGAKSILDIPATLEMLAALSVPVLGFGTSTFPQFISRGDASLHTSAQCDSAEDAADLCRTHWSDLGLTTGVLLANPLTDDLSLDSHEVESLIEEAERQAARNGITGDARTPYLLQYLARETRGRSLQANLALLANNARLAGKLAIAISEGAS